MAALRSSLPTWLRADAPADKYVVWVVIGLLAAGVVAVYSAVSFLAVKADSSPEAYLWNHLVRVGLALGAMFVVSRIDYRRTARAAKWFLVLGILLLITVQVIGLYTAGPDRWLRVAGLGFQPSDLARVALVLYVGFLLTQKQGYIKSFTRTFVPLLVWVLPTVGLILIDDLSTALMLLCTMLVMGIVGRVSTLQLGGMAVIGLALAVLLVAVSPHRAARVESYLGVDLVASTDSTTVMSTQGERYQSQQARIAFAMGGLTGVGPGKSVQRDFLPAPYNDFIFAIIAEEYGLVGALLLLFGFCVLLFRGYLRIARDAPDPLGLFLATGLTTMIVAYGFVHAGVACGLLPVTGLPMPFVSYGGSSLLANGVMVGVLLNISRQVESRTSPAARGATAKTV